MSSCRSLRMVIAVSPAIALYKEVLCDNSSFLICCAILRPGGKSCRPCLLHNGPSPSMPHLIATRSAPTFQQERVCYSLLAPMLVTTCAGLVCLYRSQTSGLTV